MLTRLTKDFNVGDNVYRIDISVRRDVGDIFINVFNVNSKVSPKIQYMITKLRTSGKWHLGILKSQPGAGSHTTYDCTSYLDMKQKVIKFLICGE